MSGFVLTPAAEGDLPKIVEYLEGDSPGAIMKVVEALDESASNHPRPPRKA